MTITELLKRAALSLGWLLVADAVATFGLGLFEAFRLGELAAGVVLVAWSRSLLPMRNVVAVAVALTALAGLARIAYWLVYGLLYGTPHPFAVWGYAWRTVLFLGLGGVFLRLTRNRRAERERAA